MNVKRKVKAVMVAAAVIGAAGAAHADVADDLMKAMDAEIAQVKQETKAEVAKETVASVVESVKAAPKAEDAGTEAVVAAQEAVAEDQGQDGADDDGRDLRIIEAVCAEGGLQVVRAEHVEAAGVGDQHADGEDKAQGVAVQGRLDVVGRAAVAGAVRALSFIDLG